jgi:arsenite methyltransferase
MSNSPYTSTVNYGVDKPELLRGLAMTGLVIIAVGLSQFIALRDGETEVAVLLLLICLWLGAMLLLAAGSMYWSSKTGKHAFAVKMIEELNWQGKERVLDVGCGRGLLTILAARKAPQGQVIGIDIWSQEQLSENTKEAATANADAENVFGRVYFDDGDVTNLRYAPNSFDKIISSFCLSAVSPSEQRKEALLNLVKLLRPGGEIAILDTLYASEYQKVFEEQRLENIRLSPVQFLFCLPARYILARKRTLAE